LRNASQSYLDQSMIDLNNTAECDLRLFWYLIKKKRNTPSKPPVAEIVHNGNVITTSVDILSIFASYFENIYRPKQNEQFNDEFGTEIENKFKSLKQHTNNTCCPIMDAEVTEPELIPLIQSLKTKKAPGWDKLQNEHIRHGGHVLVKQIARLFTAVLKLEQIPAAWKRGVIIPIHKGSGKSTSDMDNYRPITLLPCLYKLFEKVMQARMNTFIIDKQISFPSPQQQGFQKGMSCTTAAFNLQETLQYNIDNNSSTYAALIDTRKAFDTVWHHGLMVKLHDLGFHGKYWRLFVNTYENIESAVMINRKRSRWFLVRQGIRQGGVCSAFLYLVYINKLLIDLVQSNIGCRIGETNCSCPTLADDVTLLANSPNGLQKMLDIVYSYSCNWRYEVNPNKSNIIIFSRNKKTTNQKLPLNFGNTNIPQVTYVSHLGIRQEGSRSTLNRTRDMCRKARNSFFGLSSVGVHQNGLNPRVSIKLYKSVVMSTLTYGCEVWNDLGNQDYHELNTLQHMCIKRIQNFKKLTRSDMCESMLGMQSITAEVDRRKLLFLQKLCDSHSSTISSNIFHYKLNMYRNQRLHKMTGYIPDIHRLLNKYKLSDHLRTYIETLTFPTKYTWKGIVNIAVKTKHESDRQMRMNTDSDFSRFRQLHENGNSIALPYQIATNKHELKNVQLIAKLWVTKPSDIVKTCTYCQVEYSDLLLHIVYGCSIASRVIHSFKRLIDRKYGGELYRELDTNSHEHLICILLGKLPQTPLQDDVLQSFRSECLKMIANITRPMFDR
ncbi:MAG: reverse transcriptase family protein, partial [Sedimenticola sp.]